MGVLNQDPALAQMFNDLNKRIAGLEQSKRFTVPTVVDSTKYPQYPQSGDMILDASSGYLYIFIVQSGINYQGIVSTSSNTVASSGSLTFLTSNTGSFLKQDRLRIYSTASPANYIDATVSAVTTNVSLTVTATGSAGSGTFAAWTITAYGTWRQLLTTVDLVASNIYVATSSGAAATATISSVVGGGDGSSQTGATIGTGGDGIVRATGFSPDFGGISFGIGTLV